MSVLPVPNVDPALCIGCRLCADTCPNEVLDIIDGVSQRVRPQDCEQCGVCEAICPQGAITMEMEDAEDETH